MQKKNTIIEKTTLSKTIKTADELEKKYTVFVGGIEVNDSLLSHDEAMELAWRFIDDGYDDVVIQ